jgi:hypothetical protein
VNRELKLPAPDLEYLQGLANALVALLPNSYTAIKRLLGMANPKEIYELHFSIFGALNRSDFNELEQDGLEYLLAEYLRGVNSTAAYAAWKAGLVLGEDWLTPKTEGLLADLMTTARFPAGRLGAINGYRWVVQQRGTSTDAELAPLRRVARNDKSLKVRENAKFNLKHLSDMHRKGNPGLSHL